MAASQRDTIPASGVHVNPHHYEGIVRKTLMDLGSNHPDADLSASHSFWKHCYDAGVEPQTCAAVIYGTIRHRHTGDLSSAQTATLREAAESPTREEWEVVVRQHGSAIDKIARVAGRRPDEAIGNEVIFGNFYDDEKAASFARRLTKAGFVAYYRPRPKVEAATAAEEGDKSAMGEDAAAAVVTTTTAVVAAAEECHTCIPWQKVARNGEEHEKFAELAKKFGAIQTPKDVYAVVGDDLNRETQEVFLVLPLNIHGFLMAPAYEVARGQRDKVAVGIDNVMDAASDARCAGYVVVHQHPGGSPKPSPKDMELTRDIRKATPPGRKFIDHIVIGPKSAYSCVEKKLYKI
jgi:hypothetical protein